MVYNCTYVFGRLGRPAAGDVGGHRLNQDVPADPSPTGAPRRSGLLLAGVGGIIILALLFAFFGTKGGVATPEVGSPAPAFRVITRDGQVVDTAALGDQVLVINFFASWCKPCANEAADLESVWQEYKSRNVLFVGVIYQDSETRARDFITSHGLTFPVATDQDRGYEKFGLTGVPETYVISHGILRYKRIGEIDRAVLAQALEDSLR
jgi:cytochrome c biogenesis protein CcmG, thiol:disulfide interchange protein DsbE